MTRAALNGVSPLFIAADIRKTMAFYRDKLGFDVTYTAEPEVLYFAIVERDRAMIMFKAVEVQPAPNRNRDEAARWDAYVHTPDPDALAAEFASRGVEFLLPLQDTPDNLRGFELRDVNGYILFFGRPIEK